MILNEKNYKEALRGISIVEVSGESCANCISLIPILATYVKNKENVMLHHLEVTEETRALVSLFQVVSVPSVLVFYNEELVASCRGFQPEEILTLWLDSKLEDIEKKYL
ncbi:MAG: thioredoxin family protein [Anaeroplasmataceae bacterium]|nr:thioredoxin family protein [Anaeroplasmataceae bacterium]MDE7100826.1 thioredoxin family protein [Anaeroplasmataceae bacterium]